MKGLRKSAIGSGRKEELPQGRSVQNKGFNVDDSQTSSEVARGADGIRGS